MTRTLDPTKLDLQDALDVAVLIEEEAKERYEEFVDQMEGHHTPEAAAFFRFMAGNEKRHGEELLERRRQLFGDATRRVDRSMIWEVEAPGYEKAHAFMSPREVLEVALQCETKAYEFFARALDAIVDKDVRKLFRELCREEEIHQDLVRREIAKLPPGSALEPDDFVDEPVAQ